MDLYTLFSNPDVLKTIATVVAGLGLAGLGVLFAEFGIVRPVARGWSAIRGQVPAVVELVDEPTDAANVKLENVTHVPATVWAAFLPAFLNALATGLDAALKEQPPAQEVNIAPVEAVPQPEVTIGASVGVAQAADMAQAVDDVLRREFTGGRAR
jgi:hypothetical protein